MRAHEFIFEAGVDFQGNKGSEQASMTDHTLDEARRYVKEHYPLTKSYNVRRAEPGFRALDKNMEPKFDQIRASQSHIAAINSLVSALQLKPNAYMSGSHQSSASLGHSWHTLENAASGIAILYYEDRGMGSDEVTIAAKDKEMLAHMKQVCIDAGVIKDPAEIKAAKAAKAAGRTALLDKKGIKVGSTITLNGTVYKVQGIMPSGKLKVTVMSTNNPEHFKVGDVMPLAPGLVRKSDVS